MPAVRKNPWAEAEAHLLKIDTRVAPIMERHGPCKLRPYRDRFGMLVRAIVSQQISGKAAVTISGRLHELAGDPYVPEKIVELREEKLRSCGLSGQKARYVLGLAG